MFKYLLVAVLVPALVFAQTPFSACTGGRPPPQSVNVAGCTGVPCDIPHNSNPLATAVFTSLGAFSLYLDIWLEINGEHVDLQIPPEAHDGCAFLTPACPVPPGVTATYTLPLAVSDVASGPGTIEVSLIDQNGETEFCAVVALFLHP